MLTVIKSGKKMVDSMGMTTGVVWLHPNENGSPPTMYLNLFYLDIQFKT